MGSSKEGLYNGVSPSEEKEKKKEEGKTSRNNYCSTWKNYNKKESILSKIVPLGFD